MWELDYKESWVLKNWCFWTVVLEKTLESPLDCKEIQPVRPEGDQSWIFTEGLMLKLQYFGHLIRRTDSLEKTLMLGKIEGRRKGGWQRMRWLDPITHLMDMSLNKLQEIEAWRSAVHGVTKRQIRLSDYTTITPFSFSSLLSSFVNWWFSLILFSLSSVHLLEAFVFGYSQAYLKTCYGYPSLF